MARFEKEYGVDVNLKGQLLKAARLDNLTDTEQTTLGGSLTSNDEGYIIYNSTQKKVFIWNGANFLEITYTAALGTFRGVLAHDAPEPSSPQIGDFIVFSSSGIATNFGGVEVEATDMAWYTSSGWVVVQGNIKDATDTVAGKVRRATTIEASSGSNVNAFVTPQQVANYVTANKQADFYENSVNLVAYTPVTVTHNLGSLQDVKFFTGTSPALKPIELHWEQLNLTQISVGSNVSLNGVIVRIFKKS